MAKVEMVMPKMGESVMEGTVLSWLKKVGDPIEEDESILEVATDKVDTEIPATHSGILLEIVAEEGAVIQVGKPIAIIETEDEVTSTAPLEDTPTVVAVDDAPQNPVKEAEILLESAMSTASSNGNGISRTSTSGKFLSPLVRSIAKEENISMEELDRLSGTGSEGRVTKQDILSYVAHRKTAKVDVFASGSAAAMPAASQPPVVITEGADEIIEMDRMRKMIAQRMVASKQTSPHVTSFVEADVSQMVAWRNKVKNEFQNREGEKLTFTPILIEAIVKAIKDFPMINVQVDGDTIVKKNAINIGMATALPSGNLIVPVIHHADQLSLLGITKKVNDLASRARKNQLHPDELQGGTYTISNVGSFGNLMGTPIIMQPQVAIMALGAIQKKPSVIETEQGDLIGIRSKMFLSHSYDHRVVDGALGGMFVRKVADYLEAYDINRAI